MSETYLVQLLEPRTYSSDCLLCEMIMLHVVYRSQTHLLTNLPSISKDIVGLLGDCRIQLLHEI